jgi:5-deoxy-glucuronate isomerase
MSHMLKVGPEGGQQKVVERGKDGIHWLGLDVVRLAAGEAWKAKLADEEAALVVMSGKCSVRVGQETFEGVGGRADMFAGPASVVYLPRRSEVEVRAETKLELAFAHVPCDRDLPVKLITPDQVKLVSAGMANWRRDLRLYIPPGSAIGQRMILGETINPPSNWSGIPPHKHDEHSSVENVLEEFYLFKVKPANGDGVQLLMQNGQAAAHVVHNDDVAVLLDGYHPTGALPGTTVGYLWLLSGDSKAYDITIDPRYAWVAATEAVLKEMRT